MTAPSRSGRTNPSGRDPEPGLTAGAAAGRLGVAATTLRSWDRRYGLGASRVSVGGHRRYSPADMARLQRMCTLVADGAPVAEAARVVLDGTDAHTGERAVSRSGGGHTLPVGVHADHHARGLARAAMRLDGAAVRDVLGRALTEFGVPAVWEAVIQPVLYGMGRKWEDSADNTGSNRYVEVEHLLSECVLAALLCAAGHGAQGALAGEAPGRGVLLACTERELHTLPLHALNAALIERGIPTRMFGAALPPDALARAVDRTRPSAVVLWSQHAATADPDTLHRLHRCPGTTVLAAGAGWGTPPGPGTVRLTSLAHALAVLAPLPTG
ncbi:MerR family transcriptional regulator [Yinghuangia sp. YIM S09857]|uniref:MerR family transcriptional regulator n=1 Tax=Yinghuangia sp. YIM S09857 TaxID=3436929 RepID=UPI003F534824